MAKHPFEPARGRVEMLTIDSTALRSNLLGDPARRQVAVYLPEDYDRTDARYPVLVDLVGFTGSGLSHLRWSAFEESLPQRLDRLVAEGRMGPVVAVFPDAFTSLGGNQYVNSAAMGLWADYLTLEMLPRIEAAYRVRPGRASRGAFGKSSGGYGAMAHGMRHAEHWGAIACHSGDMAFEWCYLRDFPPLCDRLASFEREPARFVQHLRTVTKISRADMGHLMVLAMAATYDPDRTRPLGIRLPVDPETCAIDAERWQAWLAHDPVVLVESAAVQESLGSLRGIYLDCGTKDPYALHYGARRLSRRLTALGIKHRHEEFDDDHSQIDYRMDVSLPWLYETLA